MKQRGSAGWVSSANEAEVAAFLRSNRSVVVLTHSKPDGDAVGSAISLVRALRRFNINAAAHFFGPIPAWLKDVAGATPHHIHENTQMPVDVTADAVAIVDTGSWTQLEPMKAWLSQRASTVCLVDHHVQGDADVAPRRLIDTAAAAVCQPVGRVCMALLGVDSATKLPAEVAEALYLGTATDTGWFRHSNVSRAVMQFAGELLEAGADHIRLYQWVEQYETPGRLRLISRALASLDLRHADRLALMTLSLEDMRTSGAMPGETGGITDFTQGISSVMVSAVLMEVTAEKGERIVKISMRSKPGPVDVNAIAGRLGGGGHVRAAGAKVRMSLDEAKEVIADLVLEQLP